MRSIHELINCNEPAIELIKRWAEKAEVPCDILPPSEERNSVLESVQVTTRSPLGAVAFDTGGLIIQNGWLRFIGSGHPRLPRRIDHWNRDRSAGLYLIADDAVGGFFALNGGVLGSDRGQVYYWAPDDLDWLDLQLGYSDFLQSCLSARINDFYEELRWPEWQLDVSGLRGDQAYSFFPFLWTKEGSIQSSSRKAISVNELYDLKVDIIKQLEQGGA